MNRLRLVAPLLAACAVEAQSAPPAGSIGGVSRISSLIMEGAHHRPIRSLAFAGHDTFGWVTGDIGKATRDRDAVQSAGEVGYAQRVGADGVLGLALGYADYEQTYGGMAVGGGAIYSTYLAADLGLAAGAGEATLTFAYSHSEVSTQRAGALATNFGGTDGNTYTFRARYDHPVGTIGSAPIGVFATVSYDHSDLNHFTETGAGGLSYPNQSNDSSIVRLGLTGKLALASATDLGITVEAAKMLNENRDDHGGTDMATGVADFTMVDVRGKKVWGRLCLDLDHRLSPDTVISLTAQASTRGDAFETAGALSIRRAF